MKKTNWFILSFLILITVPTLVWAVYRLFTPGKLEEEVCQENRTLSEIKWSELLSSCQSINNWYNDRAPFRKNLISLYQKGENHAGLDDLLPEHLEVTGIDYYIGVGMA